jgi:hypothetical protein
VKLENWRHGLENLAAVVCSRQDLV